MTKYSNQITLLGIVALGTFLRIFQLGFQCMWTEEVYTLNLSKLPYTELISQVMASDFNPPLFYLLAHLSRAIFSTDIAIRYPSVLFGVLLIIVMYFIGREYCDEITGLYTAGFTAVLYPLIYYSQFGRAYEMCICLFAVTVFFYLKTYTYSGTIYPLLLGISSGLTVYTHLFAIIPAGLLILDLVFSTRRREGLLSGSALTVVCLPLLSMLVSVVIERSPSAGFTYGQSILHLLYKTPFEFFDFAFPLFVVFCIFAWVKNRRLDRLFLSVTGITILFGIACSLATAFFPRYYLLTIVLLLPVTAATLTDTFVGATQRKKLMFLSVVLAGLLIIQHSDLMYHYFTQQYVCDGV